MKKNCYFTALLIPFIYTTACYDVYNGPVNDLAEQQSVWQYLSVYSIYQERLPDEAGDLTPYQMFDMINDILIITVNNVPYGGRFTGYTDDRGDASVGSGSITGFAGGGRTDEYAAGMSVCRNDYTGNVIAAIGEVSSFTAYLRIYEFDSGVQDCFSAWVADLYPYPNVVIDLRGNLGGSLDATDAIISELVPYNSEYIRMRRRIYDSGKNEGHTVDWVNVRNTNKNPRLTGKNISVIVDKKSASASEILAAALKDCANANLVGDTTFGKGIGQVIAKRMGRKTLSVTSMQIQGVSARTGYYHMTGIAPDTLPEILADVLYELCIKEGAVHEGECDNDLYAAVRLMDREANFYDIMAVSAASRGVSKSRGTARVGGAYVLLEDVF